MIVYYYHTIIHNFHGGLAYGDNFDLVCFWIVYFVTIFRASLNQIELNALQ